MKKVIAILPMKGHSERVPKKNLRNFNGKSLYHHILETLLNCPNIEKVVIDTDCENIKKDALENFKNIIVLDREESVKGDMTSMNLVIDSVLNRVEGEYFIQTHSTNPLLKSETIEEAINKFFYDIDTYDSVFGVTELHTRLFDKNIKPINHDDTKLIRTQDLEPIYEENSNLYIFSRTSFYNNNKNRIGKKPQMFKINKLESVDIDTEEEFIIAESISKSIK